MKVYLDTEARKYEKEIVASLDDLFLRDCNFNGMSYEIEYDEYIGTDLDNDMGTIIVNRIHYVIDKAEGRIETDE